MNGLPLTASSTAFVFPAFSFNFSQHPLKRSAEFCKVLTRRMEEAGMIVSSLPVELPDEQVTDELTGQFLTYIYSCAASEFLTQHGIKPVFLAGYSMGIYAALFCSRSIGFSDGLRLIAMADYNLRKCLQGTTGGMATVIGLERNDILQIINKQGLSTRISNRNAPHSYVISGPEQEVDRFITLAMEEGALHTRNLGVSIPYHFQMLQEGAATFEKEISSLEISPPEIPVVSLIDQAVITSESRIRTELSRNLHMPLDWLATQQKLMNDGITILVETGSSAGLARNARFIDGNLTFLLLETFAGL